MRIALHLLAACVVSASALSGCSPQLHAPPASDSPEQLAVRLDHGYALLNDLLSDESKLADILVIKSASEATTALLKDISAAATRSLDTIKAMQASTPPIDLSATGLPLVEVDARHRIANSQTKSLLLATESFELKVLLTQRAACEYAWALASTLAAIDPDSARAEALSKIAKEFDALLARVVAQLSIAPAPQPAK